jgi:hypothetical protein
MVYHLLHGGKVAINGRLTSFSEVRRALTSSWFVTPIALIFFHDEITDKGTGQNGEHTFSFLLRPFFGDPYESSKEIMVVTHRSPQDPCS